MSELRKIRAGRADVCVAAWAEGLDANQLYVSAITIEELEIGVLLAERRDPIQGAMFRQWMDTQVLREFAGRILAVDQAVALRSARLHVPATRPVRDALIAATALVHSMVLATRNISDFAPMKLAMVNPWNGDPARPGGCVRSPDADRAGATPRIVAPEVP